MLIEETKESFDRQKDEIDGLHKAQERVETKIKELNTTIKESEVELVQLENELKNIDQLESEVQKLSHDQQILQSKIKNDELKNITINPQDRAKE